MATPLTLAETASVFGETLVFGRLLEASPSPESKLSLLAESIEGSIATVFRQVAMNRFEHLVHTARRSEGELSTDRFGELWAESQEELLGDAVEVTEGYRSVVLRAALHRLAGLRLRVRLRAAAGAGGLRALRGGGTGLRVELHRPAERGWLALA
jgi:oligoendopeptidase F